MLSPGRSVWSPVPGILHSPGPQIPSRSMPSRSSLPSPRRRSPPSSISNNFLQLRHATGGTAGPQPRQSRLRGCATCARPRAPGTRQARRRSRSEAKALANHLLPLFGIGDTAIPPFPFAMLASDPAAMQNWLRHCSQAPSPPGSVSRRMMGAGAVVPPALVQMSIPGWCRWSPLTRSRIFAHCRSCFWRRTHRHARLGSCKPR